MIKRLADIFEIVLLVIMLGMCAVVLMAGQGNVPYIFGYRVMQVISDSMRPTISAETCIVIEKIDDMGEIQIGDVVTFVSEDPRIEGFYNTHRVHDIITDAETGEILLQTKGDAYEEPDAQLVSFEQVAGRYEGELPFGEYLYKGIIFLTNRVNYFIVVIAPLFICFMSYCKQLLLALFKPASEYEKEPEDEDEETAEEIMLKDTAAKEETVKKDKSETVPRKKWWKKKEAEVTETAKDAVKVDEIVNDVAEEKDEG